MSPQQQDGQQEVANDCSNNEICTVDVGECLTNWVRDASALLHSDEMAHLSRSTATLLNAMQASAIHLLIDPPVQVWNSVNEGVKCVSDCAFHIINQPLKLLLSSGENDVAELPLPRKLALTSPHRDVDAYPSRHVGPKAELVQVTSSCQLQPCTRQLKTDIYFMKAQDLSKDGRELPLTNNYSLHCYRTKGHLIEFHLHPEISSSAISPNVAQVLESLTQKALGIAFSSSLEWNPLGNTSKFLKKQGKSNINKEILIWQANSDSSTSSCFSDVPLFKGQGVVNMSSTSLFHLLVDSKRVREYNKLSLGRKDLVVLHGQYKWTKVTQSTTQIPMFGKPTIHLTILIHAIEWKNGYIIISRSLSSSGKEPCEVLWNINILSSLTSDKTKFVAVNQVKSNLIPRFLTAKAGIKGVTDLFNNLNKLCER